MALMRTKLYFFAALAANLLLAGGPAAGDAHACSCVGSSTPTERLETSDSVFAGKVAGRGVEDPEPQDNVPLTGVEFNVEKSWKGVSGKSVVVYGQGHGYGTFYEEDGKTVGVENSCDFQFVKGGSYLVYASRSEGLLKASSCSGTVSLADAERDLRALGPSTDQLPDTGGTNALSLGNDTMAITVIVLTSLALAGALVVRRLGRGERT